MSQDKVQLSVIIPVFNGEQRIQGALSALMDQTFPRKNFEVLVVDNGSTDQTQSIIESFGDRSDGLIRYVSTTDRGVCAARNKGIEVAKGAVLAFTDDDCVPEPDWVERIYKAFLEHNIDALQGRVILASVIPEDIKYPLEFIRQRIASVNYFEQFHTLDDKDLVGANMAVKKSVLDTHGGFDGSPRFMLCEDTELSARIKNTGAKMFYTPDAAVHHHFDVSRLNDAFFLKQSKAWGRANILLEPSTMPRWKHFLYCVRELCLAIARWAGNTFMNQKFEAFRAKCKVYGCLGRCEMLLKGST